MAVSQRLLAQRRRAGRLGSAGRVTGSVSGLSWLTGGTSDDVVVLPATAAEAEGLPPFGRGVDLIASSVASTTWYAYRWDATSGVYVRLPEQPAIVTDPDPTSTAWHWRYAATVDLVEYGNHVSLLGDIDWATGRPGWLLPLPVTAVSLVMDTSRPGLWLWSVAGVLLDPSEVLHVSAGNRSGELLGRGALRQYAQFLGQAVAAENHSGKYLAGGGLPPAVLQVQPQPSQEQLDAFKARWRTMSRTGEPVALPASVTVTPLANDADKAQLVQARTWNAQLVAMCLGIPSEKLGLPGPTMTYTNMEDVDIGWVRDTVDRYAQPITAAMSKSLLPRGQVLRFDWGSRLRTDTKTQVEVVTGLLSAGVITVDEARARIGMPPMASVEETGTTPAGIPELTPQEVTG